MKRILIVDDSAVVRLRIRRVLEDAGYEVAGEAQNGLEAISLYRQLKPDVVTMDITMPEMSGVEALKKIMAEDSEARVVMITALDQKDKLREAILAGARDYIVKPFEDDRLLSAIERGAA